MLDPTVIVMYTHLMVNVNKSDDTKYREHIH